MKDDKITKVVMIVIGLVVIMSIIGGTTHTIRDGARAAASPNNCTLGKDQTGAAMTFNYATSKCVNSSGTDVYTPTFYSVPLQSLFSDSGVIVLVLMAAFIIGIIGYTLKKGDLK